MNDYQFNVGWSFVSNNDIELVKFEDACCYRTQIDDPLFDEVIEFPGKNPRLLIFEGIYMKLKNKYTLREFLSEVDEYMKRKIESQNSEYNEIIGVYKQIGHLVEKNERIKLINKFEHESITLKELNFQDCIYYSAIFSVEDENEVYEMTED